jgi:hypothetical protein
MKTAEELGQELGVSSRHVNRLRSDIESAINRTLTFRKGKKTYITDEGVDLIRMKHQGCDISSLRTETRPEAYDAEFVDMPASNYSNQEAPPVGGMVIYTEKPNLPTHAIQPINAVMHMADVSEMQIRTQQNISLGNAALAQYRAAARAKARATAQLIKADIRAELSSAETEAYLEHMNDSGYAAPPTGQPRGPQPTQPPQQTYTDQEYRY